KCNAPKGGTGTCEDGSCKGACGKNTHLCDGECVSSTDANNCGDNCKKCPSRRNAQAACVSNACTITCAPGFADCDTIAANGCEADLATDAFNCGACNTFCGGTCQGSACVTDSPPYPWPF